MSAFASVFSSTEGQRTFGNRPHGDDRKRAENGDFEPDDSNNAHDDTREDVALASNTNSGAIKEQHLHRVSGLVLAPETSSPPFPHAPEERSAGSLNALPDELIHVSPLVELMAVSSKARSFQPKRQHIENVTTLLHRSVLNGDWQRASRAWGLLLRTDIGGQGPSPRQHGHWNMSSELIMRRNRLSAVLKGMEVSPEYSKDDNQDGLREARRYYELLILQYPHGPSSQHGLNALSIYPALFSIWIYEVIHQSKSARFSLGDRSGSDVDAPDPSDYAETYHMISKIELDAAEAIVRRLDDLTIAPPFDTCGPILLIRGMVGLWMVDILEEIPSFGEDDNVNRVHQQGQAHRRAAHAALRKAIDAGQSLPTVLWNVLQDTVE